MTGRRWTSIAIVTLGLGIGGGGLAWCLKGAGGPSRPASAAATAKTPMRALAEGIATGDARALAALCRRVLSNDKPRATPPGEAEAIDLVAVLDGLRAGFLKFDTVGRCSSIAASTHILDQFKAEGAPGQWLDALKPVHDLMVAGLADPAVDVRAVALTEVGRHWSWLPGRPMIPAEEGALDEWKEALHKPALRCLGDREPKSRAAAVVCLGQLPIDSMAAPAAAYADDPDSGGVRYKALTTFANRPALLSEDTILRRLHDAEPGIPELAELILKGRGLTKDQVFLGRQMFDPKAEIRCSVIPLLRERTDIDPVIWLLQLSHDADETVRAHAAEALADRDTPEVDKRLREMATTDASPAVRSEAAKCVAKLAHQATAALPPLPGSPSLNPKAN